MARDLLRILTCGSVDDGKSTLLGRLLYDTAQVLEDQLTTLQRDTRRYGTTAGEIDLALLADGLEAEREQGITIDVAYRQFATPRRAFIVADAPGHEQYTRNMATGASTSELAVLLVDARKGLLDQSRRHAAICSLLGIRHVVLAVNKIDLVGYGRATFEAITAEFASFAGRLGFTDVRAIPVSARDGDNVTARSARTPWYDGSTLLEYLETVDVRRDSDASPFRLPVAWISRPEDVRGYAGTVAAGSVRAGDDIVVAGSGAIARVSRVLGPDGDVEMARKGDAVTLCLDRHVDVARGDVLAAPKARPEVADQFTADIVWMGDEHLLPGRSYLMRIGTRWVPAAVTMIKYKLNVATLEHLAARELHLNEIASCNIATGVPVAYDTYAENRETGGFILVDRFTHATAAAGMIAHGLRRATNIHHERLSLDKTARAALNLQKPGIIWFTGLSAAGKSTIARAVEAKLYTLGRHTMMLDGDNLRHGLNRDLGFTDVDRVENIRRVGEVAKLMVEAGLIVICAFISPFRAERAMVRALFDEGEFFEIFVDTPLADCIQRDPKGLYAKAKSGALPNFTGIDSAYERPENPELTLSTANKTPEELAVAVLNRCGYL
ncbi:MAG TPA: sulfate adenylyltransferase subunit CysN [Alphaproteobacteria bacterium]|nr:sulfate adenylyltransferase subunit CysN [Alphaproteobacteria bacterium]